MGPRYSRSSMSNARHLSLTLLCLMYSSGRQGWISTPPSSLKILLTSVNTGYNFMVFANINWLLNQRNKHAYVCTYILLWHARTSVKSKVLQSAYLQKLNPLYSNDHKPPETCSYILAAYAGGLLTYSKQNISYRPTLWPGRVHWWRCMYCLSDSTCLFVSVLGAALTSWCSSYRSSSTSLLKRLSWDRLTFSHDGNSWQSNSLSLSFSLSLSLSHSQTHTYTHSHVHMFNAHAHIPCSQEAQKIFTAKHSMENEFAASKVVYSIH